MKPYIIDDRDIVTANVKCIIFYTTLFAIMYKGWLEYNIGFDGGQISHIQRHRLNKALEKIL